MRSRLADARGRPDHVAPAGTSSTTTALAPIVAPSPMRTGPITFAPVPMLTLRSIVAPRTSPARRPIVTNGAIIAPACDLDEAVDHDLPVDDVDAGLDHDRVADRDLRERHREPVREARQQRHAARLQPRLQRDRAPGAR